MSDDNKKLLKYLAIIFIAELLIYKLPHDSYSIIEYIIKPIRRGDSVIYLSSIVPLILIFERIKGLSGLGRFKNKSKVLIFIVVMTILLPIMKWTLDVTRMSYHWLVDDGLSAVDIVDANVSLHTINDETKMNIKLELKDYGRRKKDFKIRIYFPKRWEAYFNKEYYELERRYRTYGYGKIKKVEEEIIVKLKDPSRKDLFDSRWDWGSFEYKLYNEKESIRIIDHDF